MYENLTSTKLIATNCIYCNKALRDPESVQRGAGPECSGAGYLENGNNKDAANKLIELAAKAVASGHIETMFEILNDIEALGYTTAADRIKKNYKNIQNKIKIRIETHGNTLRVYTPYKRDPNFARQWRSISGREWKGTYNQLPDTIASKRAVMALFKDWFAGMYGEGDKGKFRIPKPDRLQPNLPLR